MRPGYRRQEMIPMNKERANKYMRLACKKKGFSIVELIIALAITSIAIVAIYNLFITQQKGFAIQEEVANMQQNNRVAMEELARVVKMAGVGVLPPQQKILYCGPYDFVFSGNVNGTAGDVMAMNATVGTSLYTAPDPTPFVNQDSETYRWTLDKNGDGSVDAADYTNTNSGATQYSLWREVYTGTTSIIDELAPGIAVADTQGNQVVVFQYWGNFDADPALDLWGDANQDGELQTAEILTNGLSGALDPVTDLTGNARALDDMLQKVDLTVITETGKNDPNYPTNSGFRQTRHASMVTPRNLWTCANLDIVPGYKSTLKISTGIPGGPPAGDNTTIQFIVLESGIPKKDKVVTFSATIGGVDITTLGGSLSTTTTTSDVNGFVSLTVSTPSCTYVPPGTFPIGGTVVVTAVLPSEITPFGPCSADSENVNLTMVVGDQSILNVTNTPSSSVVFSCGDTTIATLFDLQVEDACGNPVTPNAPINLTAFGVSGGACFAGFGTLTPNVIPITTSSVTVSYTSEASGPYAADRTAGNIEQFIVNIDHDFYGAPNCLAPLTSLYVETFPDHITNFDPLTNPITATNHTDCNMAGFKSTDAIFNVEDSCGNAVYDMTQFTQTVGANVEVTFTPDPAGILNTPSDQGTISPALPANIQTSVAGDYYLTYLEPSCTLPPLYTRIIQPTITLTPNNFTNQGPVNFGLNLQSCLDCEIVTSTPVMSNCISDTTASVIDVPGVTVVFCGIADGTPVELELSSSAGPALNASFDQSNPSVSTIMGTFTLNSFSASIYGGNAPSGATISITAYSPDKATYATDPAGFTCSGIDIITIESYCTYIGVFNEIIQLGYTEITDISANDKLYIQVEDCDENKDSTVVETLTVTVTSPQGYSPPAPDIEIAILTETGPDTGIFNSNTYVPPTSNTPGPLPVIYCGLGPGGDTAYNGRLFLRPGYDVTVEYVDPDDPTDTGCVKTLGVNTFSCPAFVYSYYGSSYIHLDRHGITANLSLGGNIFTNGEFELSGDMSVDNRGPDGVIHTPDDFQTVSLGHMSLAGNVIGDCYAPSVDLYGPDGAGQNTQVFPPNEGVVLGDLYLMDGFYYDDVVSTYYPEIIGSRGNPPSYGNYTSLAASNIAQPPPGSSVQVHAVTGGMLHTGAVFATPNEPGYPYDPNVDPNYALPVPDGEVLVASDLPTFDFSQSVAWSQDLTTKYHMFVGEDTYFNSMAEFETFLTTARPTYTAIDGTSYTTPHINPQGKTIYIIGDPYEGTVFHFPNGFDTTQLSAPYQFIVLGMIVSETRLSIKGNHDGIAVYGCGKRPIDWIDGWTGVTYSNYDDWVAVRGGEENIPYDMIALVARTKLEVKDGTAHTLLKGIVYSENESHFHNKTPQGKAFLHGAEIANVIHNCLYMDFRYNDCVRRAAAYWYGCYCDSGGAAIACSLAITPSSATVTRGGNTVTLTGLNSLSGIYNFTVTGTSGGTVSVVGDTATYTSGPNVGTDIVSVSSSGCIGASATINVIDYCNVVVNPATLTIPLGQDWILSASSLQGGPFNWSIVQNQSGSSLDMNVGDAVTYTAGATGGIDIIKVTDSGGCAEAFITITVDPCYVLVELYEFDGINCTSIQTNTVTVNGEVCVSAVLGDPTAPGFIWYSDDPAGLFFDAVSGLWVGSGTLSTLLGQAVRYQAGGVLGTYTISAMDDESCTGTQLLSTCDITLLDSFGAINTTIYETQTVDYVGYVGIAVPARTIDTWDTTDPAGPAALTVTSPTTGTYTPSMPGNFEVTIYDNVGCSSTAFVTVLPCATITINPTDATVSLVAGNTELYTAVGGTPPYTWSTSDTNIGVIDPVTGVFTPIAAWPVPINVYVVDSAGCTGQTTVLVQCPAISVEPANATIVYADPLTPVSYSASFGSAPYSWSIDDPTVGSIDSLSGMMTITGEGTATITAVDAYGCIGTTTVTVACPTLTISPDNATFNIGDTANYSVAGGSAPYSWWIDNPAVGTIAPVTGVFNALAGGTTTINVSDKYGCVDTTAVSVACPVVTIAPVTPSYLVGATDTFSAAGGMAPYTWTSSAPLVATIDSLTGALTAVGEGSAIITGTDTNGCFADTTITATCPTLTITSASSTYTTGDTDTFTVTGGTAPYTWVSSDTTVGTIDATGAFAAVGTGSTVITVTGKYGCTTNKAVTVVCPTITIAPNNPTYTEGDTDTFAAAGGATPYTWSSSDSLLGTVDSLTGAFSAIAAGNITITVTDTYGCVATTPVTINSACSETITVTKFKIDCNKEKVEVTADSTKLNTSLDLQFVVYDGAGVAQWGPQVISWDAGKGEYRYKQEGLGNFMDAWDDNYYVIVSDLIECPGTDSAPYTIEQRKNCP